MEDIDSSPTSPIPRKRVAQEDDTPRKRALNLKGTQFVMPTPPDTEDSSNASPTIQQRVGSPAPSISTLSSVDTEVVFSNKLQSTDHASSTSKPPPAKRRKLTPSEKLEKQKEK